MKMKALFTHLLAICLILELSGLPTLAAEFRLPPEPTYGEQLWISSLLYKIHGRDPALMAAAYRLWFDYKNTPGLAPDEGAKNANDARSQTNEKISLANTGKHNPDELPYLFLEAFTKTAGVSAEALGMSRATHVAELARVYLRTALELNDKRTAPADQIAAQGDLLALRRNDAASSSRIVSELVEMAKDNPRLHEAMRLSLGSDFSDDPELTLARNPDFAQDAAVREALAAIKGPNGLQATRESIQRGFDKLAGTIVAAVAEDRRAIAELNARLADNASRERQERVDALNDKLRLEGARASVFLLSSFAGIAGDPGLAREISVFGESTIRIAESVHDFKKLAESDVWRDLSQGFAGVIATGNIVGAVLGIVSLFGKASESPFLHLSRQLEALGRELRAIHAEMRERFDRIDLALNVIHTELLEGLSRVLASQSSAQTQLEAIGEDLTRASARLERIGTDARASFIAEFDATLRRELERCVRYQKYSGLARIGFDEFIGCLQEFSVFATGHAADATSQPRVEPGDLDYATAYLRQPRAGSRFESQTYSNVNYLAAFARRLDSGFPLYNEPGFVNPVRWRMGANAYLGTLLSAPAPFARQISPQSVRAVLEPAREFASLAIELGRPATNEGKPALPRYLARLLADYRTRWEGVQAALDATRAHYERIYLRGFALDEGAKAPGAHASAGDYRLPDRMKACPDVLDLTSGAFYDANPSISEDDLRARASGIAYAGPVPDLVGSQIPEELKVAHLVGLGRLDICYRPSWVEKKRATWSNGGLMRKSCEQSLGNHRMVIDVTYTPLVDPQKAIAAAVTPESPRFASRPAAPGATRLVSSLMYEDRRPEWAYINFHEQCTESAGGHVIRSYRHQVGIHDYNEFLRGWWENERNVAVFSSAATEVAPVVKRKEELRNLVEGNIAAARRTTLDLLKGETAAAFASAGAVKVETLLPARQLAAEAGGIRNLLEGYMELGFSRPLATNAELRSLFYGNDPLPGREELFAILENETAGPAKLASLAERAREKATRLEEILLKLAADETASRPAPLVGDTIRALELLERAQIATAARPPLKVVIARLKLKLEAI
jgi:hypothetical protein